MPAKPQERNMNTEERAHLEANLSTTLTRHMEQFRAEREQWERQKAEEEAAKREKEAAAQKEKYDRLIELQQEEQEQRIEAMKFRNKLLAGLVTLLASGGGTGAYFLSQPKPEKVEAEDVKDEVVKSGTKQVQRIDDLEAKVERLGTAAVDSQVQQAGGVDYIADKIDAAHPRQADKVEEPEAVEEARIRAEEIQKKKRKAKVLGGTYDPFDDLPRP